MHARLGFHAGASRSHGLLSSIRLFDRHVYNINLTIMITMQVIGALGADAVCRSTNGRESVQINVAHNYRKVGDGGEVLKDETIWVSCFLSGNGGALLPFLRKGAQVYVSGTPHFGTYKKDGNVFVDVTLNIDSIKLLPTPLTSQDKKRLEALDSMIDAAAQRGFNSFAEFVQDYDESKSKKTSKSGK